MGPDVRHQIIFAAVGDHSGQRELVAVPVFGQGRASEPITSRIARFWLVSRVNVCESRSDAQRS
jgi:hypothetical protein